jgi:hypothetical protein
LASWYDFSTSTGKESQMKKVQQQSTKTVSVNGNKHRPEVRDNLDSRKKEEQEFKGDDITHNTKPHHNNKQEKKK